MNKRNKRLDREGEKKQTGGPWKSLGNLPRQRAALHKSSVVGSINDPNSFKPLYYHSRSAAGEDLCAQGLHHSSSQSNSEFHPTVRSILVASLITGCSFYWLGSLLLCDITEHRLAGVFPPPPRSHAVRCVPRVLPQGLVTPRRNADPQTAPKAVYRPLLKAKRSGCDIAERQTARTKFMLMADCWVCFKNTPSCFVVLAAGTETAKEGADSGGEIMWTCHTFQRGSEKSSGGVSQKDPSLER